MQNQNPVGSDRLPKVKGMTHWCYLLAGLMLGVFQLSALAQISLNVADFGAKGDAVQFYVNTTAGSALVTTANQFSTADIGKTIEIFGVGSPTTGINSYGTLTTNNQDLIATIINVAGGTNLYISVMPQATRANSFATCGTDNTPAFTGAIAAAAGYTNVTINIPSGTFLCMPTLQTGNGYAFGSIIINRGGLHFVGQGQGNTTLLSRGAWQLVNYQIYGLVAFRGFLFEVAAPITNDYPLSIENMTLDGGVQTGLLNVQGITVNKVDGLGWDEQHSAYLTLGNSSPTVTHQVLTNLTITHWRGEMIKSIDGNTNGNIAIKNCLFNDGNATALNVYPSWDVQYNTFSTLFQGVEFYQKYSTNTGFFCNNLVTNIMHNAFSFNGATVVNPPFVISNNIFYLNFNGNGIATCPGANITICNNQLFSDPNSYCSAFVLGQMGAQPGATNACNTNIKIYGNTLSNLYGGCAVAGQNATDNNRCDGVWFYNNKILGSRDITLFNNYGWTTNIYVYSNDLSAFTAHDYISSVNILSTYAHISTNNLYWRGVVLNGELGNPNHISYGSGPNYVLTYPYSSSVSNCLTTSDSNLMPSDTVMVVTNGNYSGVSADVYLSEAFTNKVTIPYKGIQVFYWTGSAWTTNSSGVLSTNSIARPIPPSFLRILN
jgi:hypothetical protein